MPSLNPVRTKEIKTERRKILMDRLGGKCVRCGATEKLDFDHIDPKSVSFRIGHRLDYSLKKLFQEAAKCQLLCKPCHRKKTRIDNGWDAPVHGTANMYNNHGCRCRECREAWTKYFVPRHKQYLSKRKHEYVTL